VATRTIASDEGFEFLLDAIRTTAGTTLTFKTRWPTARIPEPHVKFQVTLSPAALHRLRSAIDELCLPEPRPEQTLGDYIANHTTL
jgi:hypothetical protein